MDIPRPENKRKKRIRRALLAGGGALVLAALTVGLSRLEPAAPSVPRASVWIDTVREGEMLRQVRGPGTLVPREIRWIASQTNGRVERIFVRPGAAVEPDTVIIEMSNPELMRQTEEARYEVEMAKAELAEMELRLKGQQLDQRAALAAAEVEYERARLRAEAEREAGDVVPAIQYQSSVLLAQQLEIRLQIEEERLEQFRDSMDAQLAARRARVDQARNAYERRLDQVAALKVRAGVAGVLQELSVEEGQIVDLGQSIARVARIDDLRAELRIPETQARDVQLGQRVEVDTRLDARHGVIEGRVTRIDPAVQSGTVLVDVELVGPLPRGARPDLSVDGTIEIERLPQAVYTGRPAYGQPYSTISLFKLVEGGRYAVRVPVQLGRTSVNAVEIVQGLEPGDQVILSDTSAWDDNDRIRLD
ncbi:MAG TPA: efflux RND transporter periplasmic adaptor subunit [Gammaproteobacteria bacterium]